MAFNIANVRLHVERVIGNIRKKYKILGTTQPIDYLIATKRVNHRTLLDMIVSVCCALNNLCDSVIPFDYFVIFNFASIYVYLDVSNPAGLFSILFSARGSILHVRIPSIYNYYSCKDDVTSYWGT